MGDTAWIDNARADDVATWPTKEHLRTQLSVTDRTIERWVKRQTLRCVQRRVAGEKSRPVYNPDDVRVLMKEVVEVVPVVPTGPTTKATVPDTTDRRDFVAQVREFMTLFPNDFKAIIEALMSLSVLSLTQKTYLSCREASELSGLTEQNLKALVHIGKLRAIRGKGGKGRWTFSRQEIQAAQLDDLLSLPDKRLVEQR